MEEKAGEEKSAPGTAYLLEQARHVTVRTDADGERRGQSLLVLKAARVQLGPELHLKVAIFLLGKLKLHHAALELETQTQAKRSERGGEEPSFQFADSSSHDIFFSVEEGGSKCASQEYAFAGGVTPKKILSTRRLTSMANGSSFRDFIKRGRATHSATFEYDLE